LLGINQVYYRQYKCKAHKHYNYLQSIFDKKFFTKDNKMPLAKLGYARFMRIKRVEHKGLEVGFQTGN
jgi:hypothetical protein